MALAALAVIVVLAANPVLGIGDRVWSHATKPQGNGGSVSERNHHSASGANDALEHPSVGSVSGIAGNDTNPYYFRHWCGLKGALPSLDDAGCIKRFPPAPPDRDWRCPAVFSYAKAQADGFHPADATPIVINTSALAALNLDPRTNVAVVLVRRTANGTAYVRYLGHNATVPYETWSSSKIFAAINAAGTLRSACGARGLDGTTKGEHGATPFGDLLTVICSYDTTANYTSNGLARYFLDLGGRPRLHELVRGWLGRQNDSLGGNYGEPEPSDLMFGEETTEGGGERWCPVGPNRTDDGDYVNSLSAIGAAEFLRRIVMHRETSNEHRVPGITWADAQTLLYGSNHTMLFPSTQLHWGGMSADTSIYLQRSVGDERFDESSGQWRIFSKLGAGYGCFPKTDSAGRPGTTGGGLELIVASRASIARDTDVSQADALLLQTVQRVVAHVGSLH